MPIGSQLTIEGREASSAPVSTARTAPSAAAPAERLFAAPQTIRGQLHMRAPASPGVGAGEDYEDLAATRA